MCDQTNSTQSASSNSTPEERGKYLQSSIRRQRLSPSQSLNKPPVKNRSQSKGGEPTPHRSSFSQSGEAGHSDSKDSPDRRPSHLYISSQVGHTKLISYLFKVVVQVAKIAATDLLTSPLGLTSTDDPNDIVDHLVADLKEAMLAEYDEEGNH